MKVNASLSAIRGLNSNRKDEANSLLKLSSGKRINSAKDDPVGAAQVQRLKAQLASLAQENQNFSQERANLQIESGQASAVQETLQNVRALAVQASSGTLSSSDRANLQKTVDSALADVSGVADISVLSAEDAQDALAALDDAIQNVSSEQAQRGAQENALESRIEANAIQLENQAAAASRIEDADIAEVASEAASARVKTEASTLALLKTLESQKAFANALNKTPR
jgi:flagellin